MSTKLSQTILDSSVPGLGNYSEDEFTVVSNSSNISAFGSKNINGSHSLGTQDSIVEVQLQYQGFSNNWYLVSGLLYLEHTSPDYVITSSVYFDSSTFYYRNQIINSTGSTITVPTLTLNYKVYLYKAPF